MENKILLSVAFLVAGVLFLPACTENECEPCVDPKENSWWGYIYGTLDGSRDEDDMSVFVESSEDHAVTSTNYTTFRVLREGFEDIKIMDASLICVMDTELKESVAIWLSISGLFTGTKYIDEWDRPDASLESFTYSTIELRRRYSGDPDDVAYVPKKGEFFKLYIDDVRWVTPGLAAVEGELDGTLYRSDAMSQDSIIVKAKFGAGYGMN